MDWDDVKMWVIGGGLLAIFVLALMTGLPRYNVWQQEMVGRASLAKAEQDRQIKVAEARAKMESAKFESDAEIERARGVAKANEIIGDSLKGNDAYLRYLWIQGLNDATGETIYVPTEANLPILEAGKRPIGVSNGTLDQ
jgi:hypothetical protein